MDLHGLQNVVSNLIILIFSSHYFKTVLRRVSVVVVVGPRLYCNYPVTISTPTEHNKTTPIGEYS